MAKQRPARRRRLKAQRWVLGGGKAHVERAVLAGRRTLKARRQALGCGIAAARRTLKARRQALGCGKAQVEDLKSGRQALGCGKAQVEVGVLAARRTWSSAHMRARARAAARVGASRAALEEVPPRGDPRVRGDATVPAPLGGG